MLTLTSASVMSRDRSLIAEYFMHGAPARSAGARHGDSASCSAAVVATSGSKAMSAVRMPDSREPMKSSGEGTSSGQHSDDSPV